MSSTINMSAFVHPADLEFLSGRKRPSAQIRWLCDHGYRFDVNAIGRPVVLWSCVETKLGAHIKRQRLPDFKAITNG